jgi:coenzyme F420-reducing hydrogenase beta subunit
VCPLSDDASSEDEIAAAVFDASLARHGAIGAYASCFAGHVVEGAYRRNGSSGGMASWLLCELLSSGLADHVIHVAAVPAAAPGDVLFDYRVSSSGDEIRQAAKSTYYPVEMSRVLARVREAPGRYVLVGVPCFIKAARLLCRTDPVLNSRLRWFVGLVCGHLKSRHFSSLLAWQMGIAPHQLTGVDFRVKRPDESASHYGVAAWGQDGERPLSAHAPARSLFGGNWGHGLFKYKACDYCDDVFAETADVTIGDAWLPRYDADPLGTNILVLRNTGLDALVRDAWRDGRLQLEELPAADMAASQAGGLRHRRDGLIYRLARARQQGVWTPRKRVFPSSRRLTRMERTRQDMREKLRDDSHRLFQLALATNDLDGFIRTLSPLTAAMDALRATWPRRVYHRLRRLVTRLTSRP